MKYQFNIILFIMMSISFQFSMLSLANKGAITNLKDSAFVLQAPQIGYPLLKKSL